MAAIKKVRLSHDASSATCAVCVEPYSLAALDLPLQCEKCAYKCCRACVLRYVQDQEAQPAACMICQTQFTDKFKLLFEIDDKANLKQQLLQAEKRQIPLSLAGAEKVRMIERIQAERSGVQTQLANLRQQEADLVRQDKELRQQITQKTKEPVQQPAGLTDRPCFVKGCAGYLSSSEVAAADSGGRFVCIVCHEAQCSRCLDVIVKHGGAHECDEAALQSVALIQKECTACPWCFVQVQKVADCNDIFCTVCKKGFNYRTGKKIHGSFHNPYQAIPLTLDTAAFTYRVDLQPMRIYLGRQDPHFLRLSDLVRCLKAVNEQIDYGEEACRRLRNTEQLRIAFILQRLTETEWADQLFAQNQELKSELLLTPIYGQLGQVLYNALYSIQLLCDSMLSSHIVCRLTMSDVRKQIDDCFMTCHAGRRTANRLLGEVSMTYGVVVMCLNDQFKIHRDVYSINDTSQFCSSCHEAAYMQCQRCNCFMCPDHACLCEPTSDLHQDVIVIDD
jgi:hypothetical protein